MNKPDAQGKPEGRPAGLAPSPGSADNDVADKLMHFLIAEAQHKADCFDYLCWLEETLQRENVKEAPFVVLASDGTTCWGKTYANAVESAMRHDKELYEAVQALELPEPESQPEPR